MYDEQALLKIVRDQLEALPDFAQIQVHIKKHKGAYNGTEIVKLTGYRYHDDPNVHCTTDIYKLIKALADARETGTLGFSVTFKNGQAQLMQVQDFKKV